MNLKFIFGLGLTVAAGYLNAQVSESSTKEDTTINKKYLKNITEIIGAYQKNIEYAKAHNQKPPDEYYLHDYIATMDPETGTVNNQNYVHLESEVQAGKYNPTKPLKIFSGSETSGEAKAITNQWKERGPYEIGGRVRAIMFDPNDPTGKKVWAGGVSGGLWYNNDITNANQEWTLVDGFWSNTTIACIAVDPNNSQIFYVGTGEV